MNFSDLENKKEKEEPVAPKVVKPIEVKKTTRQMAIKNCKVEGCGGKPEGVPFNTVGFCGMRCSNDQCMLIISYEKRR